MKVLNQIYICIFLRLLLRKYYGNFLNKEAKQQINYIPLYCNICILYDHIAAEMILPHS